MEVFVSILGARNLSHSNLILRNLFTTLQAGGSTHQGERVEVDRARLKASGTQDSLSITLRNGQTQTVMFVRNIPLETAVGRGRSLAQWVSVFPPGDPRDLTFDPDAVPRADVPQIEVCIERVGGPPPFSAAQEVSPMGYRIGSMGLGTGSTGMQPIGSDHSLGGGGSSGGPSMPGSAAGAPTAPGSGGLGSRLQLPLSGGLHSASAEGDMPFSARSLASSAAERASIAGLAENIKKGISASNSAQRQVASEKKKLEDAQAEVERMRAMLREAEQELKALTARRADAEREKEEARDRTSRARETLKLRDLSIVEFRSTRDEAERQLSQVISERERARGEVDVSMRDVGARISGLAAELEEKRAEALTLAEEVQACDRRLLELRQAGAGAARPAEDDGGGAELRALREQLAEAQKELETAQARASEFEQQAGQTQEQAEADRRRLLDLEVAATEARERLKLHQAQAVDDQRRATELRMAADEADRELLAQASRAAQLDGQVSENKIQLRELEDRVREVLSWVGRHEGSRTDLSAQAAQLREQLARQEGEGEHLRETASALERQLRSTQEEIRRCRERSDLLQGKQRQSQEAWARKRAGLDATHRVLESCLRSSDDDAARLQSAREAAEREAASLRELAEERTLRLTEAQQRAEVAVRELRALVDEKGERERARSEVEAQLAALSPEFREEQERLGKLESEAEEMRRQAEDGALERQRRGTQLEERLRALEAELSKEKAATEVASRSQEEVAATLEAERGRLPVVVSETAALAAETDAVGEEHRAAERRLKEAESAMAEQARKVAMMRASVDRQRGEVAAASGVAEKERAREAELHATLDQTRSCFGAKISAARSELDDAEAGQQQAATELAALREERARLQTEASRLDARRGEAAARLQRARALEEDHARAESEEASLSGLAQELEGRLAMAAEEAKRLTGEGDALEATLAVHRGRAGGLATELQRRHEQLAGEEAGRPGAAAATAEARSRADALRQRCELLRAELLPAEAGAAALPGAKAALEAAEARRRAAEEARLRELADREGELERTRADVGRARGELEQTKRVKFEECAGQVDGLAQEVARLTERLGGASREKAALETKLAGASTDTEETRAGLSKQLLRATELQQEQQELDQKRAELEARFASAEQRVAPMEEETERLAARVRELASERAEHKAAALAAAERKQQRLAEVAAQAAAEEKRLQELGRAAASAARSELLQELGEVRSELEAAEAQKRSFEQQAAEHARRAEELRQEAAASPAKQAEEQLRADERKIQLLKAQLTNLSEAQAKARSESGALEGVKQELGAELRQLREEMHSASSSLNIQVEHGNLQFNTAEILDEEIRRIEGETEELTLALHDSELNHEVLLKEHDLLRRKVEGRYAGTIEDFASEVYHLRVSAEEERHQDELRHWVQATEEVENDLITTVDAARRQFDTAEAPLYTKLNLLMAECEQKVKDFERRYPEVSGSVHSVPAPLHGLVDPARPMPPGGGSARRALVIGCNYSQSASPLTGCTNDAWNVQCLLRHSLRYSEDQVLSLIDCSDSCPTPASRQPTKANIIAGLRWLTKDLSPSHSLAVFFSGYGAQLPVAGSEDQHQACLLPMDFASELPTGFLNPGGARPGLPPGGRGYRLVPFAEITEALRTVPASCKVTLVLDCCHAAVPQIGNADPARYTFQRARLDVDPSDVLDTTAWAQGPGGARRPWRARLLDLPPLPSRPAAAAAAAASGAAPLPPECRCYCYTACRMTQWCAELPIEGCVQGAFTWAFVKALTAGHLDTTVQQHMNSMRSILGNLRTHFRWLDQSPVLQLGGSAGPQDPVLPP